MKQLSGIPAPKALFPAAPRKVEIEEQWRVYFLKRRQLGVWQGWATLPWLLELSGELPEWMKTK